MLLHHWACGGQTRRVVRCGERVIPDGDDLERRRLSHERVDLLREMAGDDDGTADAGGGKPGEQPSEQRTTRHFEQTFRRGMGQGLKPRAGTGCQNDRNWTHETAADRITRWRESPEPVTMHS